MRLILPIVLVAIWLLLSGMLKTLLLVLGALSVILVVWIDHRMHAERRLQVRLKPAETVMYLIWLAWQIVLSALDVSKRIIAPGLPISPTLVRVPAPQRSAIGQTMYANSITLTPGTLSVDLDREGEPEILVHALTVDGARDLLGAEMSDRVSALEIVDPDDPFGADPRADEVESSDGAKR